jgi:hypothetical protein
MSSSLRAMPGLGVLALCLCLCLACPCRCLVCVRAARLAVDLYAIRAVAVSRA